MMQDVYYSCYLVLLYCNSRYCIDHISISGNIPEKEKPPSPILVLVKILLQRKHAVTLIVGYFFLHGSSAVLNKLVFCNILPLSLRLLSFLL